MLDKEASLQWFNNFVMYIIKYKPLIKMFFLTERKKKLYKIASFQWFFYSILFLTEIARQRSIFAMMRSTWRWWKINAGELVSSVTSTISQQNLPRQNYTLRVKTVRINSSLLFVEKNVKAFKNYNIYFFNVLEIS